MQPLAFFDLDNTLICRQRALSAWLWDFRASHGLDDDAAHRMAETLRARAYPEDFAGLRRELKLSESSQELWQQYVSGMADRAACPPAVVEGLSRMRAAGWTLGIVTNGAADIQRAKIASAGLVSRVDAVCISGEVGIRKPDARIFTAAAKRCDLKLEDGGWMVGDNWETDVVGGRTAGLRTVWVTAGQQGPAVEPAPDAIAPSTIEAIDYLLTANRAVAPHQLARGPERQRAPSFDPSRLPSVP